LVYTESDLVIPALRLLRKNPKGLHTSELIEKLAEELGPTGHNAETLIGRSDTVFSQKVRNLKSHDTLVRKGLATFEQSEDVRGGLHQITEEGLDYLREVEPIEQSLEDQGFNVEGMEEEYKKDLTEIVIEEGRLTVRSSTQRRRSQRLRDEAIRKFKREHSGRLICEVCEFDFEEVYGELGEDYIVVHHRKPIHAMEVEGEEATLEEALEKVAPLCSNCHAMVHRRRGELLSIDELKRIVAREKEESGDAA